MYKLIYNQRKLTLWLCIMCIIYFITSYMSYDIAIVYTKEVFSVKAGCLE
jgi:hypothetical protein